jgi:hypothetical protein
VKGVPNHGEHGPADKTQYAGHNEKGCSGERIAGFVAAALRYVNVATCPRRLP